MNYPATSVPVAIPYAKKLPIGPTVHGVLKSQINVPDNFAIQGDVGTLAGLTVSLNISYYYDPDLSVTLTAPERQDDHPVHERRQGRPPPPTSPTPRSATRPPRWRRSPRRGPRSSARSIPQTPLSGFATDAAGNQAFSQGLWTLTINNVGLDPGPGSTPFTRRRC